MQIHELISGAQRGDATAQAALISHHRDFIISLVKQYENRIQGSIEELIKAAELGMLEAALNFKNGQGFEFISFSVWWIRQAIVKQLAL